MTKELETILEISSKDIVYFLQLLKYKSTDSNFEIFRNIQSVDVIKLNKQIFESLYCLNVIKKDDISSVTKTMLLLISYRLYFHNEIDENVILITNSIKKHKDLILKYLDCFELIFQKKNVIENIRVQDLPIQVSDMIKVNDSKLLFFRETSYTINSIQNLMSKKLFVYVDNITITNIKKFSGLLDTFHGDDFSCNIISDNTGDFETKIGKETKNKNHFLINL